VPGRSKPGQVIFGKVECDLSWDSPLSHRKGAAERLCGIDVFHDFEWLDVFPDGRTQFRNGKSLASFAQERCPDGKIPALLLTRRKDVRQGIHETDRLSLFVVDIEEYRTAEGSTALSYLAAHLGVDITEIERLHDIAASTDPDVLRTFIEVSLKVEHIAAWAGGDESRMGQLREVLGEIDPQPRTAGEAVAALKTMESLPVEDIRAIAELLGGITDRDERLELLRAVTSDPTGRYVTGEVLAERTAQRIDDARAAIAAYQALLEDDASNETAMQRFIEEHIWLLGLDYAALRPRKLGPSGAMDFILERFDGFHDLLELKSPHDEIVKASDVPEGVPPPHEYALSRTLGQALAQALVYRDRLTRFPDVAHEIYGLRHARDPRLIIVIGKADSLPEHRRRVLYELNKSLHRVEVVPYDVLAKRAEAVLTNVELHLIGEPELPAEAVMPAPEPVLG
jgi:hypothetical protein